MRTSAGGLAAALLALLWLPRVAAAGGSVEAINAAGLRAALDAARGHVVVLNLWRTWCTPCLREIPDLVLLEREHGQRGMLLIGVAMDDASELEGLIRPFHRKHFPDFRSYVGSEPGMDTLASVVDPAWNELLPTTYYLIDRTGQVVKCIRGKRTLEQFRELAEPLL